MTTQECKPLKPISAKLIRLSPSYYYLWAMCLLHLSAVTAVVIAHITLWLTLLFCFVLLLSGLQLLHTWLHQPVLRLQYRQKLWWLIAEGKEPDCRYSIVNGHFLSRYFMVLQLVEHHSSKRGFLVVARDSCETNDYKWLFVALRFFIKPEPVSDRQ